MQEKNMNKYTVRFTYESDATEEVTAAYYKTQATNGAGLVADFYAIPAASDPSSTFSHVVSVKKVSEGVFLTKDDAALIAGIIKRGANFYDDSMIASLVRDLEIGSGGKGQVPWKPWIERGGFPPGTFDSSKHDPS